MEVNQSMEDVMKELKVTEERVREAAASCSTAKQVLEKLFPEAFKKQFEFFDFELRSDDRTVSMFHKPSSRYIVGVDKNTGEVVRYSRVGDPFPTDHEGAVKIKDQTR